MSEEETSTKIERAPRSDSELGKELIKVDSRISERKQLVKVMDDTGATVGYKTVILPSEYRELLSQDLSTAFLDPPSQANVRRLENLCSRLLSFAATHGILTAPNIIELYNYYAGTHNSIVVSSKADGSGARIAKSQFFKQEVKRSDNIYQQSQSHGLLDFLKK